MTIERVDDVWWRATWRDVQRLRRRITDHGMPSDPNDPRAQFCAAVARAEGLHVLFGNQWDEGARHECLELLDRIQRTYQFDNDAATHAGSSTLQ